MIARLPADKLQKAISLLDDAFAKIWLSREELDSITEFLGFARAGLL